MLIWWGLSAFLWGLQVKILYKIFYFNTCIHVICLLSKLFFYKLELDNFQHKHCIIFKFWHVHSSRNQSHNCKQFLFFFKTKHITFTPAPFIFTCNILSSVLFYTLYNTNTWGDSQQWNLLQQTLQLKLHFPFIVTRLINQSFLQRAQSFLLKHLGITCLYF